MERFYKWWLNSRRPLMRTVTRQEADLGRLELARTFTA